MLYFLVPSMYPRFLMTLDEELNNIPVTVRVGQAVDVVGQAGKPRTISGFQTHSTPVRLGTTERAELATEEFIARLSLSSALYARKEGRTTVQRKDAGEELVYLSLLKVGVGSVEI